MSRAKEIVRAREQLDDLFTQIRKADKSQEAQMAISAMAAGLSIVVGMALDLNRIADALENRDGTKRDKT